jgi:hypothetical protein
MLNFAQIPILGGNRFHPYYRAILNRALSLGYTLPTSSQQALQNQLVLWLVNKGIWSKLDFLYNFATNGSSDFSRINWISPSLFECTAVGSPTFTSNQGWTGNGTTSYLDTGWIPSTNGVHFTLNDASYGGKVNSGSVSTSAVEMGCAITGNTYSTYFHSRISGSFGCRANDDFTRQTAVASPVAFWHVIRENLTSKLVYQNGTLFQSSNDNSRGLPDVSFTIGCLNVGGTKQSFSNRQISMAFSGSKMVTEAPDFYTGWNNYQTSI